ncbi:hypothetical protein [Halosolutus gelatinilyticus]|nr:hypothetical protein [Halosolutus gelatinilyticus]
MIHGADLADPLTRSIGRSEPPRPAGVAVPIAGTDRRNDEVTRA